MQSIQALPEFETGNRPNCPELSAQSIRSDKISPEAVQRAQNHRAPADITCYASFASFLAQMCQPWRISRLCRIVQAKRFCGRFHLQAYADLVDAVRSALSRSLCE